MKSFTVACFLFVFLYVRPVISQNSSYFETLASWWATVTRVADAADKFMDKYGIYDMCEEQYCPNGYIVVHNESSPNVIPNGCGSYGMFIPSNYLPVISTCCNEHDICYGTCSKRKRKCDNIFLSCILRMCKAFEMSLGNDSSIVTTCSTVANTMEGTVRRLGCVTYLESQKTHCYCKRKRS